MLEYLFAHALPSLPLMLVVVCSTCKCNLIQEYFEKRKESLISEFISLTERCYVYVWISGGVLPRVFSCGALYTILTD